MVAIENNRAEAIADNSRKARENREAQREADKVLYGKLVNEEDALAGIKSKKIKTEQLASFITDPVHKVGDNNYLTGVLMPVFK